MALKQRLIGICALVLLLAPGIQAQQEPTRANQDGILLFDAVGQFFSAPVTDENPMGPFLFKEMQRATGGFNFGLPLFQDFDFVADETGSPIGAYALDKLGGQYSLTLTSYDGTLDTPLMLGMNDENFSGLPYFQSDAAVDIEIAPDWRLSKFGYSGYFVLDRDGVVHSVGDTNAPRYPYALPGVSDPSGAEIIDTFFPTTLDYSSSSLNPIDILSDNTAVINFPVNRQYSGGQIDSVTPVYLYFGPGSGLARDLEVSVEYVPMDVLVGDSPETASIEPRMIAMTNGYYVMDALGAVHSNLLALDFDTDANDGIFYNDMLKGVAFDDLASATPFNQLTRDDLNPDFGQPINKAPLAAPWSNLRDQLPYFVDATGAGIPLAVDFEVTPGGRGFYLLDAFGGVHAVRATFSFPPLVDENGGVTFPTSRTPYYGFPIARDLVLVPNQANEDLGINQNSTTVGYLVLDGFGTVNSAGLATDYNLNEEGNFGSPIFSIFDSFRSIETSPIWQPGEPALASAGGGATMASLFGINPAQTTAAQLRGVSAPTTVSTRFKFQTATGIQFSQFGVAPDFRTITAAYSVVSPVPTN